MSDGRNKVKRVTSLTGQASLTAPPDPLGATRSPFTASLTAGLNPSSSATLGDHRE